MTIKRAKPEEIVVKLRQVEAPLLNGSNVRRFQRIDATL